MLKPRLVSIIALCFNHERFLLECLESIKAQTYQNFELIITDDCSQDSSVHLIEKWLSENRKDAIFIRHHTNVGLCKTLNEALSRSSGRFISMIATDDVWEPQKIERQLQSMLQQPEIVAVVYSNASRMDEDGTSVAPDFIEAHLPGLQPPSGHIFGILADRNFIPAMSTLIRRSAIDSVGGYDESLTYEDYDMWLRLADRYEFTYLPGTVARYRIVGTSMVRTLFARPTANHSATVFRICEKWLSSSRLTEAQRKAWVEKESAAAYSLYVHNDRRAVSCLWRSALRTRSPRMCFLAATFSLGISRKFAKAMFFIGRDRSAAE